MKRTTHLKLVRNAPDPKNLLIHLIMALCESYNMDLLDTSDHIQTLIEKLDKEVVGQGMDNPEYCAMTEFVRTIMNSDPATIEEFIRYADSTDFSVDS